MNAVTGHRESCSAIAREIGEPLYGSAPTAQSWILLEQPGPWGPDAVFESNLDPGVAAELTRRTTRFSCRILLIRRRPGRYERPGLTCYLASSAPGAEWMEQVELARARDLLDLDLEALTSPEPPGVGAPAPEAFLVCTHARRDPCCAELGRMLLSSLASVDAPVWESSHQGGHRFAANLACFPHALFHGRVAHQDGPRIIEAYRAGRIYLRCYRGRSAYDPIVQSAEHFVRAETGILEIDACVLERALHRDGKASVSFRRGAARYAVELELTFGEARRESCNKPDLKTSQIWKLVSFSSEEI